MDTRITNGQLSINNYSTNQLKEFDAFLLINSPLNAEEMIKLLSKNQLYYELGFTDPIFFHFGLPSEKKEKITFLAGDTAQIGGMTFYGGTGRIENDWSGKKQIGGKSSFAGISVGFKHDTKYVDTSFNQDILKGEVQATIGGENVLPLAQASATALNAKTRVVLDKDIPGIARGVEAQGNIASAKAYIGVDNASIGASAKAAIAEGEVSGIFGIPFTDYNIKATVGGSAVGIGGEIKFGKEMVVDLRFLLGAKVGLGVEKKNKIKLH